MDSPSQPRDPRGETLKKAMILFWREGAEQTSYPEIVAATGASRKALYGWWPEKGELIRDSLALYQNEVLDRAMAPLESGDANGLAVFWNLIEAACQAPDWRGCYLCRSGAGPLAADPAIRSQLEAHVDRVRDQIAASIAVSQAKGEIAGDIDPDQAGLLSAALVVLISTLGAQGGWSARIAELIRQARVTCGLG